MRQKTEWSSFRKTIHPHSSCMVDSPKYLFAQVQARLIDDSTNIAIAREKSHIDGQVLDQEEREEEEREEAWTPVVLSYPSSNKSKPSKAAKKQLKRLPQPPEQKSSSSFWFSCSALASEMGNSIDDTATQGDTKIAESSWTCLATELRQPAPGATSADNYLARLATDLSLTFDDASEHVVQKQPADEVTDTNNDAISSDDTSELVVQKLPVRGLTDTSNDKISNEELTPEESRHIDDHGVTDTSNDEISSQEFTPKESRHIDELATEQPKGSEASTLPASKELSSSPFWFFLTKLACLWGRKKKRASQRARAEQANRRFVAAGSAC